MENNSSDKEQEIVSKILELLNGESVKFAKSILQQIIFCLDAVSTVDYKGAESKNSTDFLKGVFKGFSDFQKSSQKKIPATGAMTGGNSATPFQSPRRFIEFEIDAQGANYDSIKKGVKKICADYENYELHLKIYNLSPVYNVDDSEFQDSKVD